MFLNKRHFCAGGFSILSSAVLGYRLFLVACASLATIVFVFLFAPPIMLSHTFSAPEPPEDDNATSSTISLSVADDTDNIALDIASLSPSGTFRSSSATNNISVSTNNYTGYTLGIAAKVEDDNALSYTPSGSATIYEIPSITTSVSAADYADDTYASTNGLNNTWGYRPSTLYDATSDNNVANIDFLPGPTSTVDQTIIAKTKAPNDGGTTDGYNIAIGARVDNTTPPGSYTNTFVITAVANPISYMIAFNKGNTTDTVSNLPANQTGILSNPGTTTDITLTADIPTRNNYAFAGWCSAMPTTSDNTDTCNGTTYSAVGTYALDATADPQHITLYAIWVEPPADLTFKVGENIETIMVVKANTTDKFAPEYATSTHDVVITAPAEGSKYNITVVPKANYKLGSWTRASNAGTLASSELLTTTYTAGSVGETFTANGVAGSYNAMKDFTKSSCTAAGNNVTDERDGKSYTVALITNNSSNTAYCYMLSNLRLEGGTTLNTATSDVTANTFTLPNQDTWTSSAQNHYCEARMRYINNEYYYNWYAAMANPTTGAPNIFNCARQTSPSRDSASLGSICPKNWALPIHDDTTIPASLWDSGTDPGFLATTGYFLSGSNNGVGSDGYWWSDYSYSSPSAYDLEFSGTNASLGSNSKDNGASVRCIRSS